MTANLQVVVARRKDVLKVPNAALRFRPKDEAPDAGAPRDAGSTRTATQRDERGVPGRVFVLGPEGAAEADSTAARDHRRPSDRGAGR